MDMFFLWSQQIHAELHNLAIGLVASFVKFVAHHLPKKHIQPNYEDLHTEAEPVDNSKTIITVDFKNLLVEASRYPQEGMTRLNAQVKRTTWQRILFWKDVGYFYRRLSGYDRFVKALHAIPNTLLYLYTSEQKPIADRLLQELRLTKYFPIGQRLYRPACKKIDNKFKKHVAYVDQITQRVIILTANVEEQCDDSNESSRHFLGIPWKGDEDQRMKYAQLLGDVIQNNRQRDRLHEELQDSLVERAHYGDL